MVKIHADRLELICRTHRGKTYLVKELLKQDKSLTFYDANQQVNKLWNDKNIDERERYHAFAELLDVDEQTITKDQFMKMIEEAIDSAPNYYMDALESVSLLCANLTKFGGLAAISRRLNKFADKL